MASALVPKSISKRTINLVVPLPPPVTGMTAVTKIIATKLESAMHVRTFNLAGRQFKSKLATRAFRAFRCVLACCWITVYPRKGEFAYLVPNASNGLFLTLALALLLKLKSCRLVLHHHVYSYINHSDRRMQYLDRLVGATGFHVLLSKQMRDQFKSAYPSDAKCLVVHNGFTLPSVSIEANEKAAQDGFTIGHLSNLSLEKGLDTVLEVFRTLKKQRPQVRLMIGGGTNDPIAKKLLSDVARDFPQDVVCCGPIYGAQKNDFYREIDVFLMPSRYANEAQPLVIIESHQFGKPVLATDRGTMRSAVGIGGEVLNERDFAMQADAVLKSWIDHPAEYQSAREASFEQAKLSIQEGVESLQHFLDAMSDGEGLVVMQEAGSR